MADFENNTPSGEENKTPENGTHYNNPYNVPAYSQKVGYTPNSAYGNYSYNNQSAPEKKPSRAVTIIICVALLSHHS